MILHLPGCRMAPAFGGHRAGAAADENDQIGLIDDRARFRRAAVGADHADGERMLFVNRAFAADGRRHRRREPLGEFEQAPARARGNHDAAAADENRIAPLRVASERRARRESTAGATRSAGQRPYFRSPQTSRSSDQAVLHIERQSDMGRAGTAGGDLLERCAKSIAAGPRRDRAPRSISSAGA